VKQNTGFTYWKLNQFITIFYSCIRSRYHDFTTSRLSGLHISTTTSRSHNTSLNGTTYTITKSPARPDGLQCPDRQQPRHLGEDTAQGTSARTPHKAPRRGHRTRHPGEDTAQGTYDEDPAQGTYDENPAQGTSARTPHKARMTLDLRTHRQLVTTKGKRRSASRAQAFADRHQLSL